MNKSIEDRLLNTILSKTKDNTLIWTLSSSIFNSETQHNYKCNLNSDTIIKIEINLDENLLFNYSGSIWVENPTLTNGKLLILRSSNSKVEEIAKEVFSKFIKPKLNPKPVTQDSILERIIDSVSVVESRDRKIDEIIDIPKKKWKLF